MNSKTGYFHLLNNREKKTEQFKRTLVIFGRYTKVSHTHLFWGGNKKNRAEKLSEEMMQIFQKLVENNNPQIQRSKLIPGRINIF